MPRESEPEVVAPADVVVVGAGPGGLAAAVEAARSGASVTVLEVTGAVGGNAARASGYVAFLGSELQRETGVEDSEEAFLADLRAEVDRQRERYGVAFDEALAQRFVASSRESHAFLSELGLRFGRLVPRPQQHTVTRMVALEDTSQFRTCFERALAELGIRALVGVRADRLAREDGRVAGVRLQTDDAMPRLVRAARAVVLATGGYQGSKALRRLYQPEEFAETPFPGLKTCRGDGHVMGQAVGGALVNMTVIPTIVMVPSGFVEDAIAVNAAGERFHDEPGPYDARVEALLAQPQAHGHYVFDHRTATRKQGLIDTLPQAPLRAPSLEALAGALGCDAATLRETVAEWNALVESGASRDPTFERVIFPDPRVGIVDPPFYAARMVLGANFTAGGFLVTMSMQVIDVHGDPVPGLYAAGDCVGGINAAAGLGGIHIGSAVALGRVAGRAAAGALIDERTVAM